MRLLIVGTLNGQLTLATKYRHGQGRHGHPRRHVEQALACCAPAAAPTS